METRESERTVKIAKRKLGISIDDLLGDVDQQGVLRHPSCPLNFHSDEILGIGDYRLCYAFHRNNGIVSFSLPNLQELGIQALYGVCSTSMSLRSVDMSGLVQCGNASQGSGALNMGWAFAECTSLESINLSSLVSVDGYNAMANLCQGCTSLTTVNLSSLTSITGNSGLQYAFDGCASLTNVDLSNLTTLNAANALQYAFRGCTSLTSIDLSGLGAITATKASMLANAFQNCTSLVEVDLSNITEIGRASIFFSSMCQGCTALKRVYLSKLSSVNTLRTNTFQNTFNGCTALELVDFSEATSVPALTNINAFSNTNETFKIVVPDNLYSSWVTASNWSSFSSHIISKSDWDALQS